MFIIYSTLHHIPFLQLSFLSGKSSVGNLLCQSILHNNNKENAIDFFSRRTLKIETNRSFSRKNTFKIHKDTKWGLLKLVVIKTWWYLKKNQANSHCEKTNYKKYCRHLNFARQKLFWKLKTTMRSKIQLQFSWESASSTRAIAPYHRSLASAILFLASILDFFRSTICCRAISFSNFRLSTLSSSFVGFRSSFSIS